MTHSNSGKGIGFWKFHKKCWLLNLFSILRQIYLKFFLAKPKLINYFLIPELEIPLFLTKALCQHFFKQLSHYRQTAETAQTDLAAEKVVSSGLQQEVRTTFTRLQRPSDRVWLKNLYQHILTGLKKENIKACLSLHHWVKSCLPLKIFTWFIAGLQGRFGVINFDHNPGCKESQFFSLPFGQAVASMY